MSLVNIAKEVYGEIRYRKNRIFWRRDYIKSLQRYLSTSRTDDPLYFTQEFRGVGLFSTISASQNREEFSQFLEFLKGSRYNYIVEIGTDKGGTLFVWSRIIEQFGTLLSIDLDTRRSYSKQRRLFYSIFAEFKGVNLRFLAKDSHLDSTYEAVCKELNGASVDLLFIDGDHTYAGVRRDYELYSPLVKQGGFIVFHDIRTLREGCGVPEFWAELKEQAAVGSFFEFCERDFSELGGGIGVISK